MKNNSRKSFGSAGSTTGLAAAALMLPVSFALSAFVAAVASPADSAASVRTRRAALVSPPRAKYEPARGVYLGAALDSSGYTDAATRVAQITAAQQLWQQESGKKDALYLHFLQFPHDNGQFPQWDSDPLGWASAKDLCTAADATGSTPVLTLEPQQLQPFYTDWQPGSVAYEATAAFAKAAGEWNKPIFVRFAHEMNGSWYPWDEWIDKNRNQRRDPGEDTGNTPELYRKAYRNVALMFRRYAPNVALVWCPNSGLLGGERRDPYRPWYPGDDVVDWVGLDVYERGWTMPMPGAHLWAGQFAYNLTHDAADDPNTPQNESVDFYKTFAVGKGKPLMMCETGATLSFRTDLDDADRTLLSEQWKAGFWNANEYGWLQNVFGTSYYKDQTISYPIDQEFPMLKAIIWFQIAKREYIPVQKTEGGQTKMVWFDDSWADYRVGGSDREGVDSPLSNNELQLYHRLTAPPYFLSSVR